METFSTKAVLKDKAIVISPFLYDESFEYKSFLPNLCEKNQQCEIVNFTLSKISFLNYAWNSFSLPFDLLL